MRYVRFLFGMNSTDYKEKYGGYAFRSNLWLTESEAGAGVMTITRACPVVAMKLSMPLNDETPNKDGYFEPEFRWYDPSTGEGGGRLPLSGLDGNSRYRFLQYGGALKDMLGRDSVQLNKGNHGYDTYRTANAVHSTPVNADTIWHVVRLNPGADDKADFLVAMDLSTICAEATAEGGIRCLDTTDIKLSSFSLGFCNLNADTLAYETGEEGDTLGSHTKTLEERPLFYLKWIKTFPSMKDFNASLTEENGWGDGFDLDMSEGVATYYPSNAFVVPKGLTAGIVSSAASDKSKVFVDWCYPAGSAVPARTGVVLKGSPGSYNCFFRDGEAAEDGRAGNNLLRGTEEEQLVDEAGYKYFKLSEGSNGIGFYYAEPGGNSITNKANKAYLALPENVAEEVGFFSLDWGATGIPGMAAGEERRVGVHTAAGVRVRSDVKGSEALKGLRKGVYIVDGRKLLIR